MDEHDETVAETASASAANLGGASFVAFFNLFQREDPDAQAQKAMC
jgi:hypothetical protein